MAKLEAMCHYVRSFFTFVNVGYRKVVGSILHSATARIKVYKESNLMKNGG